MDYSGSVTGFSGGIKMMGKPFVAILMGSDSDLPIMEASFEILKKFEVPFEVKVLSAHRTPEATHSYVRDADTRGCSAFICAAGMAAHLAGAVAANTLRPVIGVPTVFLWLQWQSARLVLRMRPIWRRKFWVYPIPNYIKSYLMSVRITPVSFLKKTPLSKRG